MTPFTCVINNPHFEKACDLKTFLMWHYSVYCVWFSQQQFWVAPTWDLAAAFQEYTPCVCGALLSAAWTPSHPPLPSLELADHSVCDRKCFSFC